MGIFDAGRALAKSAMLYDNVIDSYSRGRTVVASFVPCKVAQTRGVAESPYWDQMTQHGHRVDFIVDADALGTVPEVRDIIEWNGRTLAVIEPDGEPCYSYHDRLCTVYRIHAEEAVAEPATADTTTTETPADGGENEPATVDSD